MLARFGPKLRVDAGVNGARNEIRDRAKREPLLREKLAHLVAVTASPLSRVEAQ